MALRVLLADESSTIKKVFQLALQDYAVEVRPVNLGVDVLPITEKFQPDIIFADILLQKRSGYEVCHDLKANPQLKNVPVVLMWSGFMDLDEDKFQACQANARLEKPFDVKTLRKIINDLVPKTKDQSLSQYLSFPKMPEFQEKPKKSAPPEPSPMTELGVGAPPPPPTEDSSWNMEQFAPIDPPPANPSELSLAQDNEEKDSQWVQAKISHLKPLELPSDSEGEDLEIDYVVPEEKLETNDFLLNPDPQTNSEVSSILPGTDPRAKTTQEDPPLDEEDIPLELEIEEEPPQEASPPPLTETQLEQALKAQSKEVIESIVWKVVPELATQIIERELKRLLEEKEASFKI